MLSIKDEKLKEIIREQASQFIQRESNGASMITVTNIVILNRGKNARILFTVWPESKQQVVTEFLKRQGTEFQDYVRKNSGLGRVPFFDFDIDFGEKNRQNIDQIGYSIGIGEGSVEKTKKRKTA
jgi:ribosome-binding factor A